MIDLRLWLDWLAAFAIVVGALMLAAGVQDWWIARKAKHK
jgi:hypothetical protein